MLSLSDDQVRRIALFEIAPIVLGMRGVHAAAEQLMSSDLRAGPAEAARGAAFLRELRPRLAGSAPVEIVDDLISALEGAGLRERTRSAGARLLDEFGSWALNATQRNIDRGARGDGEALAKSARLVAEIALLTAEL